MRIPSLKKIKAEDLGLLYVDSIREWAKAPRETRHADLAAAAADELERRGKLVPTDQVRAEMDQLLTGALDNIDNLRARLRL